MRSGENVSLFVRVIPAWLELVSLASCVGVLVCRLWCAALLRHEVPARHMSHPEHDADVVLPDQASGLRHQEMGR
jgi:hypothetical protein